MGSGPPPAPSSIVSQLKLSSSPLVAVEQLAEIIKDCGKMQQKLLREAGKK